MEQQSVDVERLPRYCVVCGGEYGPGLETHCTDKSLVAIKRVGLLKKETLFFTLDGEALSEDDLSRMRETEAARVATWKQEQKEESKRRAKLAPPERPTFTEAEAELREAQGTASKGEKALSMVHQQRLDLGGILSTSWAIFKKHFRTILTVTLVVYFPINVGAATAPNLLPDTISVQEQELWATLIQLVEGLVGILATMAIAFVVEKSVAGEDIRYSQALKKSFSRWGSVIGTNILAGIALLVLTLLLIVPGIVWGVYYSFSVYVVALRDVGGKEALDYSKSLVKGRWWRVFGNNFGLGILFSVFYFIVEIPFLVVPMPIVHFTLIDIIYSFFIVASTVFFLNLDYLGSIQRDREAITAR
jgi:hypothetical protein